MSRKNKNYIAVDNSLELLQGFGFSVEKFNEYQFRIRPEESESFFDWYHTTGTLTEIKDGMTLAVGKFVTAERVAEFIRGKIK